MTGAGKIDTILVVGGGTAGWMAASYLNRFLAPTGCRVTLVESDQIGTIGVGEATIPTLVKFVREMELDEAEFMRRTHATYKVGIRFDDWVRPGHGYFHPFGVCGSRIDTIDLFHFWLKGVQTGRWTGSYSDYSIQKLLSQSDLAPRPVNGGSAIIDNGSYAYHLDATALADYLREIAVGEGVTHLRDTVGEVAMGTDGMIARIDTEGGHSLEADLYIDCTGFAGLLIEQGLDDPWVDWSHLLLCDRAVVLPLAPDGTMPPYTVSTGLDAGWMWRIPLSHRTGSGYVYSSAHTDDDAAANTLIDRSGAKSPDGAERADPRLLKMRVGHRKNFWTGNCISVGLAAGFIEPLESTGIYFIQKALEMLLEYFPDRTLDKTLIRTYNAEMEAAFDEVRDFVLLHYLLNQREDTEFWRDARAVAVPDTLAELMALYRESGKMVRERGAVFHDTNFYFILAGGECLPRRYLPRADFSDFDAVAKIMDGIKVNNLAFAERMPSHQALMEMLHRGPQ